MEPDLAAWAEKIAIGSTNEKRGIWYGAAVFWIVVTCIIAARIMFVDPSRSQPTTALPANHSTSAGGALSASPDSKS